MAAIRDHARGLAVVIADLLSKLHIAFSSEAQIFHTTGGQFRKVHANTNFINI
jgi:hypothetical protein